MAKDQFFFIIGLFGLPIILALAHAYRQRLTLGPFFGLGGVFSLLIWQLLQTGWWVDIGPLHFNSGLSLFVPPLLLGLILSYTLDGLRTARAYMLAILATCITAWLFSSFREALAQHVPLPYLIIVSNREHFSIIAALAITQPLAIILLNIGKPINKNLLLPTTLSLATLAWLICYSLLKYGMAMGAHNLANEFFSYLFAAIPSSLMASIYAIAAERKKLFMPVRGWKQALAFWRSADAEENRPTDTIIDSNRIVPELQMLNRRITENSKIFEAHMQGANYGIILVNGNGKINRINKAAEDILGRRGVVGTNFCNLVGEQCFENRSVDLNHLPAGGARIRLKNEGRPRWIELQMTHLSLNGQNEDKTCFVTLKDVSEQIADEESRLISSRVRDLHATGQVLAHDFSNLLVGAEAQLKQIAMTQAPAETISAIQSAIRRAREMLAQLGTGSQFGTPILTDVVLSTIIHEAVAIVSASAEEAGIRIKLQLCGDSCIRADASQMIRVFTNLIQNAIRASKNGTIIKIYTTQSPSGIQISIIDEGEGMTHEQCGNAFDPGFSTKGGGHGGLGLAISYLMVEAHGGHLELVPNKNDKGICATVWLPRTETDGYYRQFAGRNVIVASPDDLTGEPIVRRLESNHCATIAEVRTTEELLALIDDTGDWAAVIPVAGFLLPAKLPPDIAIIHPR